MSCHHLRRDQPSDISSDRKSWTGEKISYGQGSSLDLRRGHSAEKEKQRRVNSMLFLNAVFESVLHLKIIVQIVED